MMKINQVKCECYVIIIIFLYTIMVISVMYITSFNILADVYVETKKEFMDKWYPTLEYKDLLMRNRFSTLIKYIKGDIILLQEVTPYIRKKLSTVFGSDYNILPLSKHKTDNHNTGNLTMIRKNKFKNIIHTTFYVYDFAFGLTKADDISIYNMHLHDSSKVKRKNQLKKIIDTFDINNKIIIGGDFNSNDKELHSMIKNLNFKMNVTDKKGTYLCEKPMIDYIYCYGFSEINGYIDNSISNKNCYTSTIKKYGSDHHPIYLKCL